jgi:hypothetical protein
MSTALKEWSAAVHALLAGRQSVLLRKGGIGEKRFELTAQEFLLFPTVAHSHAQRVRPEHRDLLDAAARDSSEEHITVRACAKVVAAVEVNQPDRIDDIADLHIWTHDSVRAERLDFRPKHRLTVLVIGVRALAQPIELPRLAEYAGCKSWVQLDMHTPDTGVPVHDSATLQALAERVRHSVG